MAQSNGRGSQNSGSLHMLPQKQPQGPLELFKMQILGAPSQTYKITDSERGANNLCLNWSSWWLKCENHSPRVIQI